MRLTLDAPPDRRFFTGMAVAAALVVFTGFARTFYLRGTFDLPPLSRLLVVHGALFTAWILLFVAQTSLVALNRTGVHRRLGLSAALLVPAMLVVGFLAAVDAARRGATPPGGPPPLVFMAIPFADLVVFGALAAAGLALRGRREAHKRLMLLATIGLLTPAIARLPGIAAAGPLAFFGLADLFIVACLAYDRATRGRVHPAFVWGSLFLVLSQPLRLVIAGSEAWLRVARWIVD